jgi:hypothetical protein
LEIWWITEDEKFVGKNETKHLILFMNLEKLEKIGKVELNTIYNLDCLIGMEFIADKSVDLILCDLPYG